MARWWTAIGWAGCAVALAAEPGTDGSLNNGAADVPARQEHKQDGSDTALLVETLRRNLFELTQSLDQTRAELHKLQASLGQMRGENEALRRELEQKTGAIKALTENLAVSQTELELFRRKNEQLRVTLQNLGGQIRGEGGDLEKKFTEAVRALEMSEHEQARLRVQLSHFVNLVEALLPAPGQTPSVQELRERILADLAKAKRALQGGSNGNGAPVEPDGRLEAAKVVREDGALQLVVLNIGRANGVRVGMPFAIYEGDKVIARARVVDVRENICGAMVTEAVRAPKIGDLAVVQRSGQ
jgi:hypothetical protein